MESGEFFYNDDLKGTLIDSQRYLAAEKEISGDETLERWHSWYPEWEIYLDIKVTATTFTEPWFQVFRIGSADDTWNRVPSLWLHQSDTEVLEFRSEIGNDQNYESTGAVTRDQWTTVIMKQTRSGSSYFYVITVNGVEVENIENTNPVINYLSDL